MSLFKRWCTHRLVNLAIGLTGVFAAASAFAQVSNEMARQLLRESGFWSQLADVRTQVRIGLDSGLAGQPLSTAQRRSAHALIDRVFAPQVLRAQVASSLRRYVSPQEAATALQWYATPTGRLITGLEVASSSSAQETQKLIQEGNQALGSAGVRRKQQLLQLVEVTRAAELMAEIQIRVAVGMLNGLLSRQVNAAAHPAAAMERELRRQKPQMVAASAGVAMALSAAIYATLTDSELEQYLAFLGSAEGMRFQDAVFQSFGEVVTRQSTEFGKGLGDLMKAGSPPQGGGDCGVFSALRPC